MTDYHALFSLKGKTALITGGTGGLSISSAGRSGRCLRYPSGKSGSHRRTG